jgi:hypothetical protein
VRFRVAISSNSEFCIGTTASKNMRLCFIIIISGVLWLPSPAETCKFASVQTKYPGSEPDNGEDIEHLFLSE